MLKNRLRYLLLLLCTGTFFLFFNGYLSLYVFALSLALPAASLLISLPGMLSARIELSLGENPDESAAARPAAVRKGSSAPLRLKAYSAFPLPGGRIRASLTVRNSLTGTAREERFSFTTGRTAQVLEHSLSSACCGMMTCTLAKVRACDLLGLFSLPRRAPAACVVFFYPTVYEPDLSLMTGPFLDAEGERYSQLRPGNDPTELFALRDYREGDRLSQIHWKLSQKTGQTLVKELGMPIASHLLFLLDLSGSAQAADGLLDAFATCSAFLTSQDMAHRAACRDPASGRLRFMEISSSEDAAMALEAILSIGAPPLGQVSREDFPQGGAHILYLCSRPDPAAVRRLREAYPTARISVLCFPEDPDHPPMPPERRTGAQLVLIQPGKVRESLDGLVL